MISDVTPRRKGLELSRKVNFCDCCTGYRSGTVTWQRYVIICSGPYPSATMTYQTTKLLTTFIQVKKLWNHVAVERCSSDPYALL